MIKRLLIINPNTTAAVTDRMAAIARAMAGPEIAITAETGAFGARYISDRASFAIAGHAALEAYARHAGDVDGVLLACFGDPGLLALKEIAPVPVTGLAEASFTAAATGGRRFGIVTGGVRWRPMLAALVDELGFGAALAGIETLTLTGGEIAANPDAAVSALAEACVRVVREKGAEAVILGGAGLAGLAERVAPIVHAQVEAPVLCSVEAGLSASLASLGHPGSPRSLPAVASTGLSPALTALLQGSGR
jgi:Asp/Glu/hydantoin racemase